MRKPNKAFAAVLFTATLWQFPLAQAVQPDPLPAHVVQQQVGGYKVRVGDVQVTALSDGTIPIDVHALLKGAKPEDIDRLLMKSFQRNPLETSINSFLITLPGHQVLIDTGAGQLFGPGNGGRLLENLAGQGLKPEDITDVLLTHAHSDHSGGLVRDGQRVFPNATVYVGKPDVDFFFDENNQKRTGYEQKYFDIARLTLQPYLDAGKLRTFSHSEEVLPGITATLHPGHTPGSAFYKLTSAGESLTFVGDLIHVAAVQFPMPGVTITFDQNQAKAAAVRKAQFAAFTKQHALIAAPHLPYPGMGHLRGNARGGYDWVPITYIDRQEP